MEEQKSVSKSVVATISALAAVAVVAGGGLAWLMSQQNNQTASNQPSQIVPSGTVNTAPTTTVSPPSVAPLPTIVNPQVGTNPTTSNPLPTVAGTKPQPSIPNIAQNNETVKIWRLDDDGKKTFLVPQERQVPQENSKDPDVLVKRPLSSLLASAGKPDGKLTSTIPVGTKLLSANVKPDGIHIDLSKEFTKGFGATSMIGRLGQVIYTATSQNPDAPVWISVEGKPLETLGDVGAEIRQPITRQQYDQDFPINPSKSTAP
jgi:spore germination protein GerM